MSEYITVNLRYLDDPNEVELFTNLNLAPDGPESYADRAAMDEGSPLAQTLVGIDGLAALRLNKNVMIVRRVPSAEWSGLLSAISDALKDFFL